MGHNLLMYRLDREEIVQFRYIGLWALLSFQAGYMNAFGFLACGRYVSHVTGFGTQIGAALASQGAAFALELSGFPFFFVLGSFSSGLVTCFRIERGLKPRFELVMGLVPVFILILLVLGQIGQFGAFGDKLVEQWDFMLLFLLSFTCGMQNGCIAVLTRGLVRTTHLTGTSTDIGTDFARILSGKLEEKELLLTRKTNYSRIATFFAFTAGSILSVIFSARLEYASLIAPFITSIVIFCSIFSIGRRLDLNAKSNGLSPIL